MKISEVLVSALKEVDEAGIKEEGLRVVAFGKVIDLLLGNVQASISRPNPNSRGGSVAASTDEGAMLQAIANRLKLDVEAVAQVFSIDDGELQLVIGPGKLNPRKSGATKEIALLVAAGRQAAGIDDEWTSLGVIRKVCEDYRRLDSPNFAAAIKEMEDWFSFRGNGTNREVRMSRPAWEQARELIIRLIGGGEG